MELSQKFKKAYCTSECRLCRHSQFKTEHGVRAIACTLSEKSHIDMWRIVNGLDLPEDFIREATDKQVLYAWQRYKDKFIERVREDESGAKLGVKAIKRFWIYKIHSNYADLDNMVLDHYTYDFGLTPMQNVRAAIYEHAEGLAFDTVDDISGTLTYLDWFLEKERKKRAT